MRYIKMLGLAAVAALAVMAVVGAASASATTVCTSPEPCPTAHSAGGKMYEPNDVIVGTSTNATLTSSLGNVTCKHSETALKLTTTGSTGVAVQGDVISLTFTECTLDPAGSECVVTVQNLPYAAEATVGTAPNGTLKVTSGGSGNPGANVECAGVINCTFSNTVFNLPVDGGNPAKVTASKVGLLRSGGLCPNEATWDATYSSTTPVYLTP